MRDEQRSDKRALVIGSIAIGASIVLVAAMLAWSIGIARQAQREAVAAREMAEREAARARALNAFLAETLSAANPDGAARDLTLDEVLQAAEERLGTIDDPEIEARLRETIEATRRDLNGDGGKDEAD